MVGTDGPAGLLSALRDGGVGRIGDDDAGDLESWAAAEERAYLVLDTQDCATERDLCAAFGSAFDLPDDEPREWDAIDECLGDYDVAPARGLVVLWTGWDGLDEDTDHVVPVGVDALATAATAWAAEGRPWTVLVCGDGPSWDLPWWGGGAAPWEAAETDGGDEDWDEEDPEPELSDADMAQFEDSELSSW